MLNTEVKEEKKKKKGYVPVMKSHKPRQPAGPPAHLPPVLGCTMGDSARERKHWEGPEINMLRGKDTGRRKVFSVVE